MRTGARRSLVSAVAALALLTACSSDKGGGSGQDSAPGPQSSASSKGGAGSAGTGKSGAGVEDIDLKKVIVEQTVPLPKAPEDKVKLGVLSLRVEGKVMILRLAVTPQFTSASKSESLSLFGALGKSSFRPRLIDAANFKEYRVIDNWQSNDIAVQSLNGAPMLAWAYFSAPEDDISSIDLRIDDNFPAFTDVPITR